MGTVVYFAIAFLYYLWLCFLYMNRETFSSPRGNEQSSEEEALPLATSLLPSTSCWERGWQREYCPVGLGEGGKNANAGIGR